MIFATAVDADKEKKAAMQIELSTNWMDGGKYNFRRGENVNEFFCRRLHCKMTTAESHPRSHAQIRKKGSMAEGGREGRGGRGPIMNLKL